MEINSDSHRILVVDDHPTILEILSEFLTINGYDVVAAQDGGKAMELLAMETFDLVLTDLQMPIADGWMVAEWAKLKNPSITVVLLSGTIEQYTKANFTASMLPFDEVLRKPINLSEVLGAVKRHLSSSSKTAKASTIADQLTAPVEATGKRHPTKS
jgi:CheY-like chemotaxis protein